MNDQSLECMLLEGKIRAEDVLRQTSAEEAEGVVEMLLRHLPYHEVRGALYERICTAPLDDVVNLTMAYYKHCEHPAIPSRHRVPRPGIGSEG